MFLQDLFSADNAIMFWLFCAACLLFGMLLGLKLQQQKKARQSPNRTLPPKGRTKGAIEIYVGNLAYEVSEKDLGREFENFGKTLSCRIIKNRFNGKSKGYGFVEMADGAEASAAVRALNGKDMKGRKIVVNEARSRSREK